jgi:hypothetical protein
MAEWELLQGKEDGRKENKKKDLLEKLLLLSNPSSIIRVIMSIDIKLKRADRVYREGVCLSFLSFYLPFFGNDLVFTYFAGENPRNHCGFKQV